MSVLVTGGSGVLGAHTVAALANAGRDIVSLSTSGEPGNFDWLLNDRRGRVTFLAGDINDLDALAEICRSHEVDGIIHSAARTGEAQARAHTPEVYLVNVLGTVNVFEVARRQEMRRVIHIGSASEYGGRTNLDPIPEDDIAVEGLYAESKYTGHRIGERYRAIFGLSTVTARVSSVYGPYTRFNALRGLVGNTLISHLCKAIVDERAVELPGGDYPRGWTYAADAAEGLRLIYEAPEPKETSYNVASGHFHTVRQIVEAANRIEPQASVSVESGMFEDDEFQAGNLHGPLDISRLQSEFGFSARFGLDAGLASYLSWWRYMRDHPEGRTPVDDRYLG